MFSLLFVLLNLLIGLLLFYNFYFKRRKFPPGPAPLPLIGNMLQFRNEMPENCFLRWRRQYGSVFTIWFGELPLVCVTDYAIIMETFQKDGDAYAGRISKELGKILRNGSYGVILTEGELWREQRRFSLHVFRDFGVGKNLMQEKILSELELMYERIDREAEFGNEMDIGELLNIGIGSIINNLLFGYRFDDKRLPEFRKLKCLLRENFVNLFSHYRILFNWNTNVLRRLPFLSRKFEQLKQIEENLSSFFAQQIKVHMKEIDMDDVDAPSQNLVEAFLKEKARRDATGEAHGFTIDQLNELCSDLWMAGQETTSNTLAWGFAYLIHHPDVQAKIQREIDDVIGEAEKEDQDRRQITVADRAAMHYTNATINEIQRAANLVPLNVMHKLTRDVVIDGYRLPKGCAIAPQISAILADGKIFDNPSEFRPERFLDEEGKLKRTDELIPFSVGKRQCLGEPLARMELFLFLANLLNRYRVSIGNALPSLERKLAATVACPEFRCRIEKRCHKAVHE